MIRHNQAYLRIIQAYFEYCNPGIIRTLVYSESRHIQNQWHIQNPGLFRTLGYSEPKVYSGPCQTSTMECFEKQLTAMTIFVSYNYFRSISFSCPLVHEINMIFSMQVSFSLQKSFFSVKKYGSRGQEAGDREI